MYRLWGGYFDYRNWLFFDGRRQWPDPSMGSRLLTILLGLSAMIALLAAAGYRAGGWAVLRRAIPWLLALSLVLFMVSPPSGPLYEWVPVLKRVGFPWRIFIIADLALAMMLVLVLDAVPADRRKDRVLRIALGSAAAVMVFLELSGARNERRNLEYFYPAATVAQFHADLAAGLDTEEYVPAWVTLTRDQFLQATRNFPQIRMQEHVGQVQVLAWQPRRIRLHVDDSADTDVVIRQFYFAGWQAINTNTGGKLELSPTPGTGLLDIRLPKGRYDVSLSLEPLWQERVGESLSALTLLALIVFAWVSRKRAPIKHVTHRLDPAVAGD
jgi:hypothetical protein